MKIDIFKFNSLTTFCTSLSGKEKKRTSTKKKIEPTKKIRHKLQKWRFQRLFLRCNMSNNKSYSRGTSTCWRHDGNEGRPVKRHSKQDGRRCDESTSTQRDGRASTETTTTTTTATVAARGSEMDGKPAFEGWKGGRVGDREDGIRRGVPEPLTIIRGGK